MASSLQPTVTLAGPAAAPLIGWRGNAIRFLRDPIRFVRFIYQNYGEIAGVAANHTEMVFAFKPEYNRQILSDSELFHSIFDATMPKSVKKHRRGKGLIQMNSAEHKRHRRLMMPALHRHHIVSYRDDMVSITQQFLDQVPVGQVVDIGHVLQQLTLSIVCKSLLGIDVSQKAEGLGLCVKNLLETPWTSIAVFPFNIPGTPFNRMITNARELDNQVLAMIDQKRQYPEQHHDLLTMLIQARDEDGTQMTDEEVLGQTTTLLITGHETSSNMMTWTLFLLAQHPEILANLLDELDSVLHGEAPTLEQLKQLPLLDRVIKESLRILPPSSVGSRVSKGACEIGPYQLPKDAIVVYSQYITHRLPYLYSEPNKFNPARWELISPSTYEYLPFGGGPRLCIGQSFAMLEIQVILAMLLQRYRMSIAPNSKINLQMRLALSPKNGMPMYIARQDRQFAKVPVCGNIRESVDLT